MPIKFKKDDLIMLEGTKEEVLYLIKEGSVDIIKKGESGKKIKIKW